MIPWTWRRKRGSTRGKMDAYYKASLEQKRRAAGGVQPHRATRAARGVRAAVPSVRSYTRAFRSFRKRYPRLQGDRSGRTRPTTTRSPRSARTGRQGGGALTTTSSRRYCRGCKIVAADVIDEANMVRWVRSFRRYARRPRIWGLHNYSDTNLLQRSKTLGGTSEAAAHRASRAGVAHRDRRHRRRSSTPNGRTLFPTDENRAQTARPSGCSSLAKKYRRRIKPSVHLPLACSPATANRFDAGLLRRDGTARPAFDTLVDRMKNQGQYFGR